MNFLQKIISRGILKRIQKLSEKDPEIRAKWDKLGKDSQDLAKSIVAYQERAKNSGLGKFKQ
jgi:hypothetical protein